MEKPFDSVAASVPVVAVTFLAPVAAFAATDTVTDRRVGLFTVVVFTVTPGPKSTIVTPWTKLVNLPITVTLTSVLPTPSEDGKSVLRTGSPATRNPDDTLMLVMLRSSKVSLEPVRAFPALKTMLLSPSMTKESSANASVMTGSEVAFVKSWMKLFSVKNPRCDSFSFTNDRCSGTELSAWYWSMSRIGLAASPANDGMLKL
jgi:hypothetical protein